MVQRASQRDPALMSLSAMPATFAAGTTVEYTRSTSDYPANAGWSLKLYLAGAGVITPVTASASGADHVVLIPSSATSGLPPGNYTWRELATKSSKVYVVASGVVVVEQNIATAGAGDMQSFAEKMLAAVRVVIAGRIPADVENYQVSGVAITKLPMPELMKLENSLDRQVKAERNRGRFGIPVEVTFGSSSVPFNVGTV